MPSDEAARRYGMLGIGIFATIVTAYSIMIAEALLMGVIVTVLLVVLFLFWRFVRAHERIATALEARKQNP